MPICGVAMIDHTCASAKAVTEVFPDCSYVVATDDVRIQSHCEAAGDPVVMTDPNLPSGSDRAMAACAAVMRNADIVLNLQGDAPFTPSAYLQGCIQALRDNPDADVATPVVPLDWAALDLLRTHKRETPFSGTTVIMDAQTQRARWFSKNIIPAIRKEDKRRETEVLSPVLRHVGLYAFRTTSLQRFVVADESPYERTEGLEQLRALELGLSIQCVVVKPAPINLSGIDTPQDLAHAEALLKQVQG